MLLKLNTSLAFGRKPTSEEMPDFEKDLKEGAKALGKDNIALIVHGQSFPSKPGENMPVGSPYSAGALDVMRFIKTYQFNGIQLGPDGELSKSYDEAGRVAGGNPSPYDSKTFAGNTLFIILAELSSDKWSNILTPETLDKAKLKQTESPAGKSECNFKHAFVAYDEALQEAWSNFKVKRAEGDPVITKINAEFQDYKEENKEWLDKEAIFDTLLKEHANDERVKENWNHFKFWNDGIDKDLFGALESNNAEKRAEAQQRKQELDIRDNTEFFRFSQFVLNGMKEKIQEEAQSIGIKTMADKKVAFSDSDVWANQSAFTDGWKLGVPPDYFSKTGQAWGFPVINPEKVFERYKKGTIKRDSEGNIKLGPAGKLLFATFDKIFKENSGGVRIDHIIGLIDPYVYPEGKIPTDPEAGRLYSSPEISALTKWSKVKEKDINPETDPAGPNKIRRKTLREFPKKLDRYAELLEYIVIPAAEKNGVPKSNIICEDLGICTRPIAPVLKKLNLGGIRVTQFENPNDPNDVNRASNIPANYWATMSTHDNVPLAKWTDDLFNDKENKRKHIKTLTEDLKPQNPKEFKKKLASDPKEFNKAKAAALFASPARNLQIFWTDLLGIKDIYNIPGTLPENNFKLRIPDNFEDVFYRNLEQDKGLNLPEVMKIALESKHNKQFIPLISKLDRWAKVLKEKETE